MQEKQFTTKVIITKSGDLYEKNKEQRSAWFFSLWDGKVTNFLPSVCYQKGE